MMPDNSATPERTWAQKYPLSMVLAYCQLRSGNPFLQATIEHLHAFEADLADLRTRLHQEQQDAADQAAQLLVLHEEARKLQGDVQDMNRQIGEAHRATSGWIEECGKRTEGRKAAEQGLQDFKESTLAGLKEAYGQGEWLNVHYIIEELKEELSAASLPVQGEPVEGKEVGQNG